jgi:hypothetical protein
VITHIPLAATPAAAGTNGSLCKITAAGIALIAGMHFAAFGFFLFKTAITAPISDMFGYLADYLRFRGGQVALLEYLWQPHGEHRLLWTRLLTWLDVEIFHTRAIPFITAATGAILLTAGLVWYQLWRAQPRLGGSTPLGLLAPMVILSTANVVDCSVPINTTYPITVFFIVLALVLFAGAEKSDGHGNYRRTAAILAAFGAGLTTAAGMLVWPILLWTGWLGRAAGAWMAILAALGAGYTALYLTNLPVHGLAPASQMDVSSLLSAGHLGKLTDYFIAFLGLPFTREPDLGLFGRAVGLALLLLGLSTVLTSALGRRASTRLDRIGIGMILLALGSAALAAVGRSDLVDEVRVPIRYTLFATTLQVGLLFLLLPRLGRQLATPRARLVQNTAGLIIAAVLLIQQILVGRLAVQITTAISSEAECFAQGIRSGRVSDVITRDPESAQEVLMTLRQNGLLAPRSTRCAQLHS